MELIKSKLKRRLRKKLHLGEFQELGFEVSVNLKKGIDETQFNKFLDDFIDEIEKNKLQFGGGGNKDPWQGFVASEKRFTSPSDFDKGNIADWLKKRSDIDDYNIGDFLDAWNDPKWNY